MPVERLPAGAIPIMPFGSIAHQAMKSSVAHFMLAQAVKAAMVRTAAPVIPVPLAPLGERTHAMTMTTTFLEEVEGHQGAMHGATMGEVEDPEV